MFSAILQQLLDGLTVGMVYVLLAAGLSVIFGVMHVINFAHGELFALGAYFAVAIAAPIGGSTGFYVALVTAPLLVGILGVLIERFTVRPLYGRNPLYHILLTFGLVLVINDSIFLIWGPESSSITRPDIITGSLEVLGFTFSRYALFIIFFGGAVALAVWAMLKFTRYGLIIRAGAQDRQMVQNLGINIDRYYSLVFGLGAALAAIAGIIIAGRSEVSPSLGFEFIIEAFVIVVLGGLGSFPGAVVGGLGVGILQESILRPFVPQLEGMVIFVLMIGVLVFRPQGLFGSELEKENGSLIAGSTGGLLPDQVRFKLGAVMVVFLALLPIGGGFLFSEFWVEFGVRLLIWGLFALALDFVMGYTGLVSLGHALFWGLGAYVSAIVLVNFTGSALVAAAAALVVGAAVAWGVGYLSIRVHGVYFALITLAFAELYFNLVRRLDITGGSEGLFGFNAYYGIAGTGINLDQIAIFVGPVTLTGASLFYYIALAALIASFLITRRMLQSPFGAVLKSIRENEERVRFLGYNPTVYKRRAFVVSGVFATLAGALFSLNTGFVSPGAAAWERSADVVVMVILGGLGTLFGPIIGAFAFFGLEELIQHYTGRWRLVLGLIFVFFVIFLPKGIVSLPAKLQGFIPDRLNPTPEPHPDKPPGGGDD